MLNRNRKVTFRLNQTEYAAFKEHVLQTGLSQEGYLRMLIAGHVPKELPPIEYHKLLRELYAIIKTQEGSVMKRAAPTTAMLICTNCIKAHFNMDFDAAALMRAAIIQTQKT